MHGMTSSPFTSKGHMLMARLLNIVGEAGNEASVARTIYAWPLARAASRADNHGASRRAAAPAPPLPRSLAPAPADSPGPQPTRTPPTSVQPPEVPPAASVEPMAKRARVKQAGLATATATPTHQRMCGAGAPPGSSARAAATGSAAVRDRSPTGAGVPQHRSIRTAPPAQRSRAATSATAKAATVVGRGPRPSTGRRARGLPAKAATAASYGVSADSVEAMEAAVERNGAAAQVAGGSQRGTLAFAVRQGGMLLL